MHRKSQGLLECEREVEELEQRIERGEIDDPLAPGRELSRILRDTTPKMTASERDSVQRLQLRANQLGAEILAHHGHTIPGNDPAKPN
jgi:hypothetical protein